MKKTIQYKIPSTNKVIELQYNNNAFIPTATSDLLIKSVIKSLKKNKTILDLGCGIGVICISLAKLGFGSKIYASDLSKNATNLCKLNTKKAGCLITINNGDRFEPWKNYHFDYIVDDISGVAEEIAKNSPWFKNVPCDSGKDGSRLISSVIKNAKKHLNKNGKLMFPIISLSCKEKIMDIASSNFKKIKQIEKSEWFLPEDLNQYFDLLHELKDKKLIDFEFKFGKIICKTEVFIAYN